MALDNNAGKRKPVGLARNLYPNLASESTPDVAPTIPTFIVQAAAVNQTVTQVLASVAPVTAKPAVGATAFSTTAKNLNRITKVSFMIDPELEKRFRKARLQSGFEKLEDAYNEAVKNFCAASEAGKINNF